MGNAKGVDGLETPGSEVQAILAELKSLGSQKTRVTYARHGMPLERTDGVSVAALKTLARRIKGRQDLALLLYGSGRMEAMYLAGLVARGAPMTRAQLTSWAEGSGGMSMIAEYTVPWVTVENAAGAELAGEWVESKQAHVVTSGWATLCGLAATKADAALDLKQMRGCLEKIVRQIDSSPNRVKYTMNGFLLAAGRYVLPLRADALEAARHIGKVSVDMGETACTISNAFETLSALHADAGVVEKRKTIRC